MDETERLLDALAPARLPPTPPDWAALSLLLALLVLLVVVLTLAHRRRRERTRSLRWRGIALDELARLRAAGDGHDDWLAEASRLARRVALVGDARTRVASLTGERWLSELDALAGGEDFRHGAGRILADGPYRPAVTLDAEARAALCDSLERLIAARSRQPATPVGRARGATRRATAAR